MSSGDKILSSDFSALFTRIENLRQLHSSAVGQTNSSAFSSAFSNPITENNIIKADAITQLNNDLTQLKQSTWYVSNTTSTTTDLSSNFNDSFITPSIGELITAAKFNTLSEQMTTLENICPVYSGRYSNAYSNAYSNRYSSQYGTQYSSQYGTRYSSQYGTQYSSQYGTRYSSQYSGRYGTRYSSQYSSKYSSQYSGKYSGQYSSKYSQYSSKYSQYSSKYSSQYTRYANKGRW